MRTLPALLLLVTLAHPASAQLDPGARIRVTAPAAGLSGRTGAHASLSQEELVFRTGDRLVSVPLSQVERLEVSRGRRPSVPGGVLGFVLGGGAGFFLGGCVANRDSYGVLCGGQSDTKAVVGGLAGAAVGTAVGALLWKREGWRRVR